LVLDLIARTLGFRLSRLLLHRVFKRGARVLRARRSLSCTLINFGTLAPPQGAAGDATITRAHFLALAMHADAIQFAVSEFQETLTVSAGFSTGFVEESLLRRLLEEMDRGLPFFRGVPTEIASIAGIAPATAE
jgi:hypothetical protein